MVHRPSGLPSPELRDRKDAMRKTLLALAVGVALIFTGACSDGGSDNTENPYGEGFDENGCNSGEEYDSGSGLCMPVGECADASDAMAEHEQTEGVFSDNYDINQTDEQIDEYNRLVDAVNEACH